MDSAFSLSEIPPEIRYSLYEEHYHLSSLYSLCNVSRQFRSEITELIFKPTLEAQIFGADPLLHLESLIEHTQIYGKQIKWLNLDLHKFFYHDGYISGSPDKSEDRTKLPLIYALKIISALQSCPNLSSLYLKYGVCTVDNDYLIKEVNDNFFPQAHLLENLRFEDVLSIGWPMNRLFKKLDLSNINLLNRLQKISLTAIDFNENVLSQIKELPNHVALFIKIDCKVAIPKIMLDAFQYLKTNCTLSWDITSGNFTFPVQNLNLIQDFKCQQVVNLTFFNPMNEEQILLLKPFKSATLTILNPMPRLREQIQTLLPKLEINIQNGFNPESLEF